MITGLNEQIQLKSWQEELKEGFVDNVSLLKFLGLEINNFALENKNFPMRVPKCFAKRMRYQDPSDPLLKQVLIAPDETITLPDYDNDPLQEAPTSPIKGLLHKYHGRVLILLTGSCAINCRYCFRRHFPYSSHRIGSKELTAIVEYISQDPSINEVILSGGDPLMLPDLPLIEKMQLLSEIPQIKRLRIHTRLPIVLPSRVTTKLLQWFEHTSVRTSIVLHTNHAHELDGAVKKQMHALSQARVTLLNQSVLLCNINDTVEALTQLSYRLFDCGIIPYYLHLLDKVQGAHHFDVTEARAIELIRALKNILPGYLVPKLAQEVPNAASKKTIDT